MRIDALEAHQLRAVPSGRAQLRTRHSDRHHPIYDIAPLAPEGLDAQTWRASWICLRVRSGAVGAVTFPARAILAATR